MLKCFLDRRKGQNLYPIEIPNKDKYYDDLLNIENSWSGRIDANSCNTFIMEAEQLLINAMELFEQGYFDCAYYSLRSAVDVSTTMVFLSDMPEEERSKYLMDWKSTSDFPMQGQMIKDLMKNGNVFKNMLEKMPSFFAEAKQLSAELNKYVHKQGFQHFYISRNHPINQKKSRDSFIKKFEEYLCRCIGVVAVMRLAIDPFPILLMDEEILYRCFNSVTDAYGEDFVNKYIGQETINEYKHTDLYSGTYDIFIGEEKKNETVFNVMKYQYIDTTKLNEIYPQLHLLHKDHIIAVLLVAANEKVVKVYCYRGASMYFTDKKSKREKMSWSGVDFLKFQESQNSINQPYDEAYISVFNFGNETYYIEHNETITCDEAGSILGFVAGGLAKMGIEI